MTEWFRNTLDPWQWALIALVPPAIIALYFLKLKRHPLEVPSTLLWRRSIEDMHVNSLWQRLRQNLPMMLQLMLVGLIILALLRPGWDGSRLAGQRFILLIDDSASMAATDGGDSRSRLDEAKRLAENVVDQMDPGMSAMIVRFDEKPQVVQEFTSNRRLLRERIATIQPSPRGTSLTAALELAAALAKPAQGNKDSGKIDPDIQPPTMTTAFIFSDGRFEEAKSADISHLNPIYVPVGTFDARNLAITAFSPRRSDDSPQQQQAFVQVANFTTAPQTAIVELSLDGAFLDASEIELPAGETKGVVFPLNDGFTGGLVARLKYKLDGTSTDILKSDDVGYAAINETGKGRMLVVTPGNLPLEIALGTARVKRLAQVEFAPPTVLETAGFRREAAKGSYDLILYDQCAPKEMPQANTLFVGRLPPLDAWRSPKPNLGATNGETIASPQILDWTRTVPLLFHVDLGDVVIADSLLVVPPAGGTTLIESTAGPIAAVAPREGFEDVVLGFEVVGQDAEGVKTANTNWPIRPSFPTFWLNVVEYLVAHGEEQGQAELRPGAAVELRLPVDADRLTVRGPDKHQTELQRPTKGHIQFAETNQPGIYEVRQGERVVERFAINLFDRQESDVAVRPTQDPESKSMRPADLRIGNVEISAANQQAPARRETWKLLLVGALFLLVLEWYIYNRRVYL